MALDLRQRSSNIAKWMPNISSSVTAGFPCRHPHTLEWVALSRIHCWGSPWVWVALRLWKWWNWADCQRWWWCRAFLNGRHGRQGKVCGALTFTAERVEDFCTPPLDGCIGEGPLVHQLQEKKSSSRTLSCLVCFWTYFIVKHVGQFYLHSQLKWHQSACQMYANIGI